MPSLEDGEITVKNIAVILLIAMINFLIVGCTKLSSIAFVACLDRYGVSRKEASLPFLLTPAVRTATGPLIGYFGKKFGPRLVVLWGGIFSFIGLFACYFAEGMLVITIFWGGVLGVGAGLGTLISPQIVSQHFKKHLDKAFGLTLSAECLPILVIPSLFIYLTDEYNLSGAFLLLSGLVSHTIPIAMLLITLTPGIRCKKESIPMIEGTNHGNINDSGMTMNVKNKSTIKTKTDADLQECQYQHSLEMKAVIEKDNMPYQTQKLDNNSEVIPIRSSYFKPLTVLLDLEYIFIMLSQSMLTFLTASVYTSIIDFCRDAGLPQHLEIYPMIIFTFGDFIGRSVVGFITDCDCLKRINLTALNYIILCIILVIIPHVNQIAWILALIFAYAFFIGNNYALGPRIITEFVKEEDLSMAMSSRFIVSFPLLLILPSLIEYFREHKGSYEGLLYFLGGIAFTCSFLTILLPILSRWKKKVKETNVLK